MTGELIVQIPATGREYKIYLARDSIEYLGREWVHVFMQPDRLYWRYKFNFKGVHMPKAEEEYVDIFFKCYFYDRDYNNPAFKFERIGYYLKYFHFKESDPGYNLDIGFNLKLHKNSIQWVEYMLPRLFKGSEE